ncbi:MAG: archaellin/type IV pilin N-terminal domain-containing protein [Candidatus Bathyarchaeia archaeon]
MKLLKSKKALSPVVASIILIAVTVAVSIAVAAWMGALTIGFMGTEQLTISKLTWTGSGFTLTVNNTGTKDLTITQIQVNYGTTGVIVQSPALPHTLRTGQGVQIQVEYAYVNGTNYDISVVTQSGYKFTDNFRGGQDKV